jgi:CBS domain-containing protein
MSMLVRHVMTPAPRTAGRDATATEVARLMRTAESGAIPISHGERLIGLVTDRDLVLRVMAEGLDPDAVRAGDICTPSPVTVSPDTRLSEARDLMAEQQIRRLPVVKGDRLVGFVSLGDVAVAGASKRAVGDALSEVSLSPATAAVAPEPERGTPERVTEHRRGAAGAAP